MRDLLSSKCSKERAAHPHRCSHYQHMQHAAELPHDTPAVVSSFILPQPKRRGQGRALSGGPPTSPCPGMQWLQHPPGTGCSQAEWLCSARLLQFLTAGHLAEEWPRGVCDPHRASMEAGKEELTIFFPGVTTVVLLESCCLLVISEDHHTNRKRNPAGEVKTLSVYLLVANRRY